MKITLKAGVGCTPITEADALALFGAGAIAKGELRGEMETVGPWGVVRSYRAITTTATRKKGPVSSHVDEYTVHGFRTMSAPKQSGYALEGFVSIGGRKHSAFTSSILFKLPGGLLVDVAVIHARTNRPE